MQFHWKDYLALAEQLLQEIQKPHKGTRQAVSEAKARSCISRAYYAAFCIARNQLQIQNQRVSVHRQVIEQLQASDDDDLIAAGILLKRLREKRNMADYKNAQMRTYLADAKKACRDANQAVNALLHSS
jgi:uncharacterized protein (UPF0332 family)